MDSIKKTKLSKKEVATQKAESAKKVIEYLIGEWYQTNWKIEIVSYFDKEDGIAMSCSMDDAYRTAEFRINTANMDTWGELIRSARHECIHLTQVSFTSYFEMIEQGIIGHDLASIFAQTVSKQCMEKAVVQIEGILDSTDKFSINNICKNILNEDRKGEI